ncbi:nucleotidyl transferase AbiEii/AbiGii toxin family protein [Methyloversatilis sp. RAC08]|uniref:nucleotidyl transferase AbiEii/AbiGii toxin family protein n=1 Tax=Methyloversatilis sp. RAC08 TaxID=1842540 RepID=UPI001F243850|nr:nucleotidyl transferase AbiEii/AbiGii toxin family protein [Methyloversatilis sp. RAC08]
MLVEILPVLAQEPRFALKGGTAINLFEHDLPRLSVDIDLAWLPVNDYVEDAMLIAEALGRLADSLRARPLQLQVQLSAGEGAGVTRLVASRGRARVQIETTPVMRGSVHPVRNMVVRPRARFRIGDQDMDCRMMALCRPAQGDRTGQREAQASYLLVSQKARASVASSVA